MFDSAMEIILQAASNSLFIFCFCNLIIAIIFVVSYERRVSLPKTVTKVEDTANHVQEIKAAPAVTVAESMEALASTESNNHSNIVIVDESCNDHPDEDEDEDEEEDDDDDEFNARIEDFIAKVNREWEAEKLKAKAIS